MKYHSSIDSPACRQMLKLCAHAFEHAFPIIDPWLPEQAPARVPGAVIAIDHPAEVGRERHQDPERPADGAREMHNGGIDGNNQIEERYQRRRVGKIVELRT